MKLTSITFTGIDERTDLDKVQQVLDVCAPLISEHDRHRQP